MTAKDGPNILKLASNDKGALILSGYQNDGYYKNIFFVDNKNINHRIFSGDFTYQKISDESLSPDKQYYVLSQIESGIAKSDAGDVSEHEVANCAFIDLSNGCAVRKENGEFCGGEWTDGHNWTKPTGGSISIGNSRPTVAALLNNYHHSIFNKKTIISNIKYEVTVDNLMACDPVALKNVDGYHLLINALLKDGDKINAHLVRQAVDEADKRKIERRH